MDAGATRDLSSVFSSRQGFSVIFPLADVLLRSLFAKLELLNYKWPPVLLYTSLALWPLSFSSNRESSVAHTIGIWALQMCSLHLIKNKRCRSETEPGHTIKEKHLDKLWYLQWWNQDSERVYPAQSYERLIVGSERCIVPRCLS